MKRIGIGVLVAASIVLLMVTWAPMPETDHALYVELAAVYDGDFDGSMAAKINKEVLSEAAPSFSNVPMILGHSREPEKCVGRTINSRLAFDKDRNQYYIEVVARIVDQDAINRIKNRLYYSVSVGVYKIEANCSLDGLDIRDCPHTMGEPCRTGGKWDTVRAIMKHMTAIEVSFVNAPGSAGAKVLQWSDRPFPESK